MLDAEIPYVDGLAANCLAEQSLCSRIDVVHTAVSYVYSQNCAFVETSRAHCNMDKMMRAADSAGLTYQLLMVTSFGGKSLYSLSKPALVCTCQFVNYAAVLYEYKVWYRAELEFRLALNPGLCQFRQSGFVFSEWNVINPSPIPKIERSDSTAKTHFIFINVDDKKRDCWVLACTRLHDPSSKRVNPISRC